MEFHIIINISQPLLKKTIIYILKCKCFANFFQNCLIFFWCFYSDVPPKGEENEPPRQLKIVKSIPLDAKGRKRRQSVSVLDVDIHPKISSATPRRTPTESGDALDAMLVDLSDARYHSPRPVLNLLSENFHNIMKDLDGINISATTGMNRSVPDLLPIKPNLDHEQTMRTGTIEKGDVVKMILRRTEQKSDMHTHMLHVPEDFGHLHYSESE